MDLMDGLFSGLAVWLRPKSHGLNVQVKWCPSSVYNLIHDVGSGIKCKFVDNSKLRGADDIF